MELELVRRDFYRVKRGQTLSEIAKAFACPPRVLADFNGLKGEVEEGQVLFLPKERHDLYTVRGGESKSLLCGSKESFEQCNRTDKLYPLQTVWL